MTENYACPKCEASLVSYYEKIPGKPWYGPDGEFIYCSNCEFTASEITFRGAAYEQEKEAKLRAQMETD